MTGDFDVAILGGGSAGAVLANRLSEGDESRVLDLTSMNRIVLEIDAQARRAVVEPGVINPDLKAAAAPAGLAYAPVFTKALTR